MFARTLLLVAIAAIASSNTAKALQPAVSNRRSFVNQLVAGTAGAAVVASTSGTAWAADNDITAAYGRNRKSVATERVGSDLDESQDDTAASLLDKMGLKDIPGAADTSTERRKQLTGQKQYGGMNTVYGSVPDRQRKKSISA